MNPSAKSLADLKGREEMGREITGHTRKCCGESTTPVMCSKKCGKNSRDPEMYRYLFGFFLKKLHLVVIFHSFMVGVAFLLIEDLGKIMHSNFQNKLFVACCVCESRFT